MAGIFYEDLDSSKDQIRIFHLFPRNAVKHVKENAETVKVQDIHHEGQDEFVASMRIKIQEISSQSPEEVDPISKVNSLMQMAADVEAYQASQSRQLPITAMGNLANTSIDSSAPASQNLGDTKSRALEAYTLTGSIKIVSLQDNPEYTALSYVWGDSTRLSKIVVNDVEVHITENLAIALEHLQTVNDPVTLWVDALCINQANNIEKLEQVMKMKRIFQTASSVLAWLGPAADQSDMIMELMDSQGTSLLEQGNKITVLSKIDGDLGLIQSMIEMGPAMKDMLNTLALAGIVESLRSLLYRDYWCRIWILQELASAKSVTIACGSKRTSLDAFELVSVFLIHIFTSSTKYLASTTNWLELVKTEAFNNLVKSPVSSPAVQMLKERRWYQESNQKRKLADMLTYFNTRQEIDTRLRATNARDKIYALLGLTTDDLASEILADYEKSVETIYTRTARKLLSQDLSLLLMAQQKNLENMPPSSVPSWAPDWRLDLVESPNVCGYPYRCFRASGKLQHRLQDLNDNDSNVLAILGTKVDTILTAGAIFNNDLSKEGMRDVQLFLSQIESYCHRSARMTLGVYGEPDQWLEQALYRIPVCDQEIVDAITITRRRLTRESELRFKNLLTFVDVYNSSSSSNSSAAGLAESLKSDWGDLLSYLMVMRRAVGRRPFLTQNGYVGVGPANLRLGDVICIFGGANIPYVIRKHEPDQHQLVGDVYVYGIMDGEFMEKSPELETFSLV